MIVYFQFPLTDVRVFLDSDKGQLPVPLWPSPTPYYEFMRSFGEVRLRNMGGVNGWLGENEICDASRAIRFSKPCNFYNQTARKTINARCSARHFYFDGIAVGKCEVVFVTRPTEIHLNTQSLFEFLEYMGNLPVRIPDPHGKMFETQLISMARPLARLYLLSSTCTKQHCSVDEKNSLVLGTPAIFAEFGEGEKIVTDTEFQKVPLIQDQAIELYHHWYRAKHQPMHLWLLKRNSSELHFRQSSHTLRLYLLRLNAEIQSLRAVLRKVEKGDFSLREESSEYYFLQHYLNEATRRISRLENKTYKQEKSEKIAKLAYASLDYISPGQIDSLLQKLKLAKIRPQIFRKVKSFMKNSSSGEQTNDMRNGYLTTESKPTVSVLFLAADPTNASRLRLGEEFREIQEKLRISELRDQFRLELPRLSLRPADISQALLDARPQIVHFSGHGTSPGALCLEDNLGKIHAVSAEALAALFEQFSKEVKCVILNACYSKIQAEEISRHIDFVVGMNEAIGDKSAIAFTIGFYQALGAGRTIEEAYRLGCVQIQLQGISGHLTPVLIERQRN